MERVGKDWIDSGESWDKVRREWGQSGERAERVDKVRREWGEWGESRESG